MNAMLRAALVFGALVLTAPPAAALTQQQLDACVKMSAGISLDQKIDGCTAAIESGGWSGAKLAWAFNNRAIAYQLKGDLDRAFAYLDQAIRLDPNDAPAYANRGMIYQARDDLDHAVADYDEAIRLNPAHPLAFNNRATAYKDKKEYDRAITDLNEAIRLAPQFVQAFHNRAGAYESSAPSRT